METVRFRVWNRVATQAWDVVKHLDANNRITRVPDQIRGASGQISQTNLVWHTLNQLGSDYEKS